MKKLFSTMLITILGAGVVVGQTQPSAKEQVVPNLPEPQQRVQRVVTIKHGNLSGILHTLRELGVSVSSSDNEHVIVSGTKDAVAGYENIIKELDVPPVVRKDIEMTAYMLVASSQAAIAATTPAELDPVIKQLKSLFNYKAFRLLDSFVLRSRDGEGGDTNGFVQPLDANIPPNFKLTYMFHFNRAIIDGGQGGNAIRVEHLRLAVKVPLLSSGGQVNYSDLGISTDVDVPEGKKVVVGKTSGIEGSDGALILVISAKVVD